MDINSFIQSQLDTWPLARQNYNALDSVKRRDFDFGTYHVALQFNPARKVSTAADVSSSAVASRPCFLCAANRPPEQMVMPFVSSDGLHFSILVNPFPIFKRHLTIALDSHAEQAISDVRFMAAMVELSSLMPDMAVFFNGARCGASAPDHMHFQAVDASQLPLFSDYMRSCPVLMSSPEGADIYVAHLLGRLVYRVDSSNPDILFRAVKSLPKCHHVDETMVNLFYYRSSLYVIPRKAFRPWQYSATPDSQLLVSPASVEVGGIFITPVEEHFEKITKDDILSIFSQVCFPPILRN